MLSCPDCSISNQNEASFCKQCGTVLEKSFGMDDKAMQASGHFFSLLEVKEQNQHPSAFKKKYNTITAVRNIRQPSTEPDRLEWLSRLSKVPAIKQAAKGSDIEKTFDIHAFDIEELKKTILAHEIERRMETGHLEERVKALESRLVSMESDIEHHVVNYMNMALAKHRKR
ncbi:MAG: hypothetical protein HYX24_05980 [Candidatus Aenigmarchaeota archaeon]|nr:hypothetical protein [Candidatus Aenigmarchaeota archaeon]